MVEKKNKLVNFDYPIQLLEEFDRRTSGRFASRAEAIRYGMRLVMDKFPKEA